MRHHRQQRPTEFLSCGTVKYNFGNNNTSGIETKFICTLCGKEYRSKRSLNIHKLYICGDKTPKFHCPYCNDYKAKQKCNLRVHIKKYHADIKVRMEN